MSSALVSLASAAVMVSPLALVCAYGPLADRFRGWRRARRPIRIRQLTPYGWAEVVPDSSRKRGMN